MVAMGEVAVGNSIGSQVPDGWHTITEAARMVGRSVDTLKAWDESGLYVPSGWKRNGELRVRLYSDEDIEAMKDIAANIRRGRPRSLGDG